MNDNMPEMLYHQVQPQSEKSIYNQFDQVSFLISVGEGRSLVQNSVRICGDLRVLQAGAGLTGQVSTGSRCVSRNTGASAVIDSISVQTQNQGLIENSQNYARYVEMDSVASLNELDMNDGVHACELKACTQSAMESLAKGIAPDLTTGTPVSLDPDFSIKPLICLNKMDRDLPYDKSGIVTLQVNLQRNMTALFGSLQDSAASYEVRNLKCTYKSIPDPKNSAPTNMGVVYNVKSNILSGTASISANVPAVCSAVAINFIESAHDSVPVYNSYKMENIQTVDEVQYLFNDSTNSLVAYQITDQQEMVERFLDAMSNSSHNQVSIDNWRANSGFGLGLNFEEAVDLSSNRFTLQLSSGVTNANPCNVYMYFFARAAI
tara:strand:- start:3378 stop:4508 length:1131 start_codon:yes stop_codon:yes gene_type:complete